MYPSKFDYYRAGSVSEALSLMQQHEDAKLLAGGHSLVPVMNLRLATPPVLIDIGRIGDLKGISSVGGSVKIGPLTTHAMIEASADVPALMSQAASGIADPQVRNRGTIGGNIAHADPASDWPTVLTALGATINIAGSNGERSVGATDFFQGLFETSLEENEIITSISVPSHGEGTGSSYAKLFHPASGYAIVGAAAVITMSGGQCTGASVAVGGLTECATKAPSVEAALTGKALNEATIAAAADAVAGDLTGDILSDFQTSAAYRKAMVKVYVKRAVSAAAGI
ncbi:MAG: xanthine dehydrogenase family protein subunit M [SAR324 cluster bacterium]|nr:xanthine dehydrogenase family protein subunit M [SAR324 cluster bacterium]